VNDNTTVEGRDDFFSPACLFFHIFDHHITQCDAGIHPRQRIPEGGHVVVAFGEIIEGDNMVDCFVADGLAVDGDIFTFPSSITSLTFDEMPAPPMRA